MYRPGDREGRYEAGEPRGGMRHGEPQERARRRERRAETAPRLGMGAPCPRCGGWVTAGDAPTDMEEAGMVDDRGEAGVVAEPVPGETVDAVEGGGRVEPGQAREHGREPEGRRRRRGPGPCCQ